MNLVRAAKRWKGHEPMNFMAAYPNLIVHTQIHQQQVPLLPRERYQLHHKPLCMLPYYSDYSQLSPKDGTVNELSKSHLTWEMRPSHKLAHTSDDVANSLYTLP